MWSPLPSATSKMSRCAPSEFSARFPSSRLRTLAGRRDCFNTTPSRRARRASTSTTSAQKTPQLVDRLRAGESIALVSDAGTPLDLRSRANAGRRGAGRRDPGREDSRAQRRHGGPVGVGLEADEFVFPWLSPTRSKDRKTWFARLACQTRLAVFFEAPHRIRQDSGRPWSHCLANRTSSQWAAS